MSQKTNSQKYGTIFSHQQHLSEMKRKAHIVKAKLVGYQFSKWAIVLVLCFGLVATGTLHATAGSNKHKSDSAKHKNVYKTSYKTNKKVKARAGNNNRYGDSHTRARVNNSINVNVGGRSGGGGSPVSINRHNNGNKNNRNNNNGDKKVVKKKKVVRKKRVVNNIDKSYTDNSYYDDSYYNNEEYDIDQTITNKTKNTTTYKYPTDDCNNECYDSYDDWGYYSDDCGCYYKTKTDTDNETNIKVSNNNDNYNNNYNKQYVDISN